jgi:hypothetical protein
MKKSNTRDTINLFFSAFLVIAFIVCAYFLSQFTSTLSATASSVVSILLYAVFGLLLFYATRVGDGKAVFRFSISTLIVMVLPSLYIIIASIASGMPLHSSFATASTGSISIIVALASVALGYGIPYSFVSGFEIADDTEAEENIEENDESQEILEGGIEESLMSESEAENEEDEDEENEVSEQTDSEQENEEEQENEV